MMEELHLFVMDTDVYIGVTYNQAVEWKSIITSWFLYVEQQWSRFQPDNVLGQLNKLPVGQSMKLPSALYDCLWIANDYFRKTEGYFSPYLKKQLEHHGYHASFQQIEKTRSSTLFSLPIMQETLLFQPHDTVIKQTSEQIDLGGIAKGYAVEYATKLLQSLGQTQHGIVDAGGDMVVWANDEKVWHIGISHPLQPDKNVDMLSVKNVAIATSSRVKRSWANGRKNHLINGQTGKVADSTVMQATVVARSLVEAEVVAKMCFFVSSAGWFEQRFPFSKRYIITKDSSGWQ